MARRLVEGGVRFVQVMPPVKPQFQPWDAHTNVKTENEAICAKTDLPSAALVSDLKARGLLDSTIVLWTGEFGRLPVSQNGSGRDHNRNAFSLLLAGGGFKAGHVHGATDDVGYKSVEGRVSVPDLHATILHQLGLDHNAPDVSPSRPRRNAHRQRGDRRPSDRRALRKSQTSKQSSPLSRRERARVRGFRQSVLHQPLPFGKGSPSCQPTRPDRRAVSSALRSPSDFATSRSISSPKSVARTATWPTFASVRSAPTSSIIRV